MRKSIALVALLVLFAVLLMSMYEMRDFGDPTYSDMDDYFIDNAQNETGASNVVTSIVFDYRGYDTLGEATVLFSAVSGVLVAIRLALKRRPEEEEAEEEEIDIKSLRYSPEPAVQHGIGPAGGGADAQGENPQGGGA